MFLQRKQENGQGTNKTTIKYSCTKPNYYYHHNIMVVVEDQYKNDITSDFPYPKFSKKKRGKNICPFYYSSYNVLHVYFRPAEQIYM